MDAGTENIYCQDLQVYFTVEEESFLYASSTRNQRIEAFWSRLKRYKLSWWIDFFIDMIINGIFKPDNNLHEELLFCAFIPILQKELNEFLMAWNSRNVRNQQLLQVVYLTYYFICLVQWLFKIKESVQKDVILM